MYNIKVYKYDWIFKYTLSEKLVSCQYRYQANINSSYGWLSFEYYGDEQIQHKDRITIYQNSTAIYCGYVTGLQYIHNSDGRKQVVSCSGIIGVLASLPYPQQAIHGNAGQIIRNLFASFVEFDMSWVQDYRGKTINFSTESQSCLYVLQEVLKLTSDWGFFINAEKKVIFWPYHEHHLLTYGVDCVGIEREENSTNLVNKVTLVYDGGTKSMQDDVSIERYGLHESIIQDMRIQLIDTVDLKLQSELTNKTIIKNCKITVNNSYPFASILPWHILSVRNSEHQIERKQVKQVQYSKTTATVVLDNYTNLEKMIKNS